VEPGQNPTWKFHLSQKVGCSRVFFDVFDQIDQKRFFERVGVWESRST